MGLLDLGTPLPWHEAKLKADQVREWGIQQLLANWQRTKGKQRDAMLWGDEVEYLVVDVPADQGPVTLSLRQADILLALAQDPDLQKAGGCVPDLQIVDRAARHKPVPIFHPEFGRFMLETTPGRPWGIGLKDLLDVESDMRWRRKIARDHMKDTEYPITLTTYPRLGTSGVFTSPYHPPSGNILRSQFVPDEVANPHIRFPTLAANIRSRRGRKVQVNVPVYRDVKTPWPWKDPTVRYDLHNWPEDDDVRNGAAPDNHIHMDAMVFGMGSCCLQITFQAENITEGRRMYDQLSPLGPIMLALTAATPIYKGFLADTDVRWDQISNAVDDRTPEELGEEPLNKARWRVPKSRYASNSTYISESPLNRPEYSSPDLVYDPAVYKQLVEGEMDTLLARHFAHLFIRDPLVIFAENLQTLDLSSTEHFENLQSTNWQHMRFKPPPAEAAHIGWRVEFRPMEIQITDRENAAFSIFMVLITRAILSFDLNFYIPIDRVTENMETAHTRDAVLHSRFWFRKNPFPARTAKPSQSNGSKVVINNGDGEGLRSRDSTTSFADAPRGPVDEEYELMTIEQIMCGGGGGGVDETADTTTNAHGNNATDNTSKPTDFPGLIPLVESYLDSVNIDVETRCALASYLDLIRRRARGQLWTAARWIREFVRAHPDYRQDSVVSEGINRDLIAAVVELGGDSEQRAGVKFVEKFLGREGQ